MRNRGQGAVTVILLVAVIVAAVGFIVYWVGFRGGQAAPTQEQQKPEAKEYKCAACGYSEFMTDERADTLDRDPTDVRRCPNPDCKKFKFGGVFTDPKTQEKFIILEGGKKVPYDSATSK